MSQPTQIQTQFEQAVQLHQQGQLQQAHAAYQALLAVQPEHGDALNCVGILLTQVGRATEALAPLQQAIALDAQRADFHSNLGRARHALGHLAQALPLMQKACDLDPESADHLCALGALQDANGDLPGAHNSYQAALQRNPQHPTARYNLATVLHHLGDTAQAVELLQKLLTEQPNNPTYHTTLSGYLLELDRVADSLEHCHAALAANPVDLMAMTLSCVALQRLGRGDEAEQLQNLAQLVQVQQISTPPGYADVEAFNSALEGHILAHPTLEHDRLGNATRNGQHTDILSRDVERGPIADLEALINQQVDQYLAALPQDPNHPFLAQRPTRWQLQVWAVVMQKQGHQLAHTHPDGWISGVYYPRVPPSIRSDDEQHSGWIEFGRPLRELIKEVEPSTLLLQPREGLLVLFPSYIYHQTVPLSDSPNRISIAFDVIPGA